MNKGMQQHSYRVVIKAPDGSVERHVDFLESALSSAIYKAENIGKSVEVELLEDGVRIGVLKRHGDEAFWVVNPLDL